MKRLLSLALAVVVLGAAGGALKESPEADFQGLLKRALKQLAR